MNALLACLLFLATVPAANWMVQNVGACIPDGPCLLPVLPGVLAPSGVLMIGLALVLRDWVHELAGRAAAALCILGGAGLSLIVAPPALALASAAAFLVSELADLQVYHPLRARGLALAVLASGVAGAVVDSALFLLLAFGSLEHMLGQVVGKLMMSGAAAGALLALQRLRRA